MTDHELGISKAVMLHHKNQFGRVSWCRLAAKLGEEVGELQGAIIRDTERRDGREWKGEILAEMKDVLTVLHVMAARMGEEVSRLSDDAGEHFLLREFTGIEKCDEVDEEELRRLQLYASYANFD